MIYIFDLLVNGGRVVIGAREQVYLPASLELVIVTSSTRDFLILKSDGSTPN